MTFAPQCIAFLSKKLTALGWMTLVVQVFKHLRDDINIALMLKYMRVNLESYNLKFYDWKISCNFEREK